MLSFVWSYFWSFKQITDHGWTIKKWAKWFPVVYAMWGKEEKEPHKKKFLWHRYYQVFNLETDVEWMEWFMEKFKDQISECNVDETLSSYLEREFIPLEEWEPAFYPCSDKITMPPKGKFESQDAYNATLAHECVHSTWHEKRLKRELLEHRYWDVWYAKEELIAEIWAIMLTGNKVSENAVAYLQSWLSCINKWELMKEEVYKAFSKAQQAVDFIVWKQFEEDED